MKSTTLNPSTATSTAGTGLCGQCYNDSSSANYPGWPVNSNKFSVKWTGQVKAPVWETTGSPSPAMTAYAYSSIAPRSLTNGKIRAPLLTRTPRL